MFKLFVAGFSISVDGYGAGPQQSRNDPLGVGGLHLHDWMFPTRAWGRMQKKETGETGTDDDYLARSFVDVGAWIMGRNMFGPVRGPWPDESWRGWWGEDPPYHVPVFVLTNHARPPLRMRGGTEFRFVTGGIHAALREARAAAGDRDIRLGGGASTIRQYLGEGLVDEMHVAAAPVLLGGGESLLGGLDLPALGYECVEYAPGQRAARFVLRRR